VVWTRNAILDLITDYGEKEAEKDPGQTNKKVWDSVAAKLEEENYHFTATQCKWKFSYLKGCYMKEKKNLGERPTPAEHELGLNTSINSTKFITTATSTGSHIQ
jgi:Myb/SANT-like DNA-binding domain